MNDSNPREQQALVRDRFTRTAEIFGGSIQKTRAAEAEILASMVSAKKTDRAIDLACGTGALALAISTRVRFILGVDLTPAMLAVAQRSAHQTNTGNVAFAIGNAQQIPFRDASVDLALTSYALHHVPDAPRVIGEISRVLSHGGRAGVIDIAVPENPSLAEMHDRIERVRDPSHTRTLARSDFEAYFKANRLRIIDTRVQERAVTFDQWMHTAGREPGDPEYIEARLLMEASIPDDLAAFHPRYSSPDQNDPRIVPGAVPGIDMVNTVIFIAAEKM